MFLNALAMVAVGLFIGMYMYAWRGNMQAAYSVSSNAAIAAAVGTLWLLFG